MQLKLSESMFDGVLNKATELGNKAADAIATSKTHDLKDLEPATSKDMTKFPQDLKSILREFKSSKIDIKEEDVQVDRKKKKALIVFSATQVPGKLAAQLTRKNGKYYKYVNNYDTSTKMVEMIFDVPGLPEEAEEVGKGLKKSGESSFDRAFGTGKKDEDNPSTEESVMQPTPTPYSENDSLQEDFDDTDYEFIDRKSVPDSDGFMTEYSWYRDPNGLNVFIFGDSDFYTPGNSSSDFETESDEEAQEWFDNYHGFDDEDWLDEEVSSTKYFGLIEYSDGDGETGIEGDRFYVIDAGEFSTQSEAEGYWKSFISKDDGIYVTEISKDQYDEFKSEDDIYDENLDETKNLTLPVPELKTGPDGDYIRVSINGKVYDYVNLKPAAEEKGYTIDVIYEKTCKCQKYSDGKALAFLNKYMIGKRVESVLRVKESSNPFKKKHICQGCGNPLSSCTCEVETEESVEEALTEAMTTETYKSISVELSDPKSELERLIKCIKSMSDLGGEFSVVVDNPAGDSPVTFNIESTSFHISSIEVKDEVNDVEVKESVLREERVVVQQGDFVVVNTEHRKGSPTNLIPVKVSSVGYRGLGFHGWAWLERQCEFDQSWIVYKATSWDDAESYVEKNQGKMRHELEESFYSPSQTIKVSDLKAFYNSSSSLQSQYPNFFAWYDAMVKQGKVKREDVSSSSATQPSNIGQHKRSKLDMFPDKEDN